MNKRFEIYFSDEGDLLNCENMPVREVIKRLKDLQLLKPEHLYIENRDENIRAEYRKIRARDERHELRTEVILEMLGCNFRLSPETIRSILFRREKYKDKFVKLDLSA